MYTLSPGPSPPVPAWTLLKRAFYLTHQNMQHLEVTQSLMPLTWWPEVKRRWVLPVKRMHSWKAAEEAEKHVQFEWYHLGSEAVASAWCASKQIIKRKDMQWMYPRGPKCLPISETGIVLFCFVFQKWFADRYWIGRLLDVDGWQNTGTTFWDS